MEGVGLVLRRNWFARFAFIIAALAAAILLRYRESPLEIQRRLAQSAAPHAPVAHALQELQYVLGQRWRRPRQRKVSNGFFQPFFGVTVVLRSNVTGPDSWAGQLHRRLATNLNVTDAIALLPAESYHVTLKTLDPILPRKGADRELSPLVASLRNVQDRLDELLQRRVYPSLAFAPKRGKRPGIIELEAWSPKTEQFLRDAEDSIVAGLVNASSTAEGLLGQRQQWHLTVGYPVQGHRYNERMRRAQREILRELSRDEGNLLVLTFGPPEVASCRSVAHFVPLFPKTASGPLNRLTGGDSFEFLLESSRNVTRET